MKSVKSLVDVRMTVSSATPEADTANQIQLMPPYKLLLFNDDFHSMDFVVEALSKVMRWDIPKAMGVMLLAHHQGQAVLMVGPLEIVELKMEQLVSVKEGAKGPLRCAIGPC